MLLRQVRRATVSKDYTLPSPIMGLNARDSISAMNPLYAITMDNYIPQESTVVLRNGYSQHAKLGENMIGVQTLAAYEKEGSKRLLAIYGGSAYNVTSRTEGIPNKYEVEFTASHCQTVYYKDRLFFMNGVDTPKVFYIDDSGQETFSDWGFSAETLVPAKIIAGAVSKEFLWFIEQGTLKAWYPTEAGAVQGQLNQFDLSQVAKKGGELLAIANWTIDGGQGIDDLTVFLTSEGEALVYTGYNPNDPNNWSLKGSYQMSRPIGYKCTMKYQGDIVIISEDGYVPLSKALALGATGQSTIAFSDVISGLVLDRTITNKKKDGWHSVIYSKKSYALFNVPVGNQFEQHVINTNTGAWCRFTGIRSLHWCLFDGELYFGSDNTIFKMDDGYSDAGVPIQGIVEQAYNNLGVSQIKKVQLLNPRTKSSTPFSLTIYTNMDFEERNITSAINIGSSSGSKWNKALWSNQSIQIDKGYKWSTTRALKVNSQWICNNSLGTMASVVFKTKTKGNKIEWYNTGIRFEVGTGIL